MKRVIRKLMFETNSSAVHSIVISNEGLEPSRLPIDKDGYVQARYGTFDCDELIYSSQEEKLSYLITQCYYLGGFEYNLDRDENYHFENVEDAICEYTGAKGIQIVGGEPDINHQAQPKYELSLVDEWDASSIQNFVFNKYVSLKTDYD